VAPGDSPLSAEQARRVSDRGWREAFTLAARAFNEVVAEHRSHDDGTEIAALIFDRALDLHTYGMTLFVSGTIQPKAQFKQRAAQTLATLWADIDRTVAAALNDAEPLIRAELQETLDATFLMVDQANAETTTERRRADLAEKTVVQLKAQHLNELEIAVWRAGQGEKTELKAAHRRAEQAQEQTEHAQAELTLLRQEVARLSGRERQLAEDLTATESRLADAQHTLLMSSFRKEVGAKEKPVEKENVVEIPSTFAPLDGMALAVQLRQRGHPVQYDPNTRTLDRNLVSLDVIALGVQACAKIADKTAYLREHLRAQGLLA
jgi:hypothetical protein